MYRLLRKAQGLAKGLVFTYSASFITPKHIVASLTYWIHVQQLTFAFRFKHSDKKWCFLLIFDSSNYSYGRSLLNKNSCKRTGFWGRCLSKQMLTLTWQKLPSVSQKKCKTFIVLINYLFNINQIYLLLAKKKEPRGWNRWIATAVNKSWLSDIWHWDYGITVVLILWDFRIAAHQNSEERQEHKQGHSMNTGVCRVWLGWFKPKEQLWRTEHGRENKQTRTSKPFSLPPETVAKIINLYKATWQTETAKANTC